jgi:hypothetical protein
MSLVGASRDEQAVEVAANYFDGWIAERWSGWNREPFTSDCGSHVSVWQKLE